MTRPTVVASATKSSVASTNAMNCSSSASLAARVSLASRWSTVNVRAVRTIAITTPADASSTAIAGTGSTASYANVPTHSRVSPTTGPRLRRDGGAAGRSRTGSQAPRAITIVPARDSGVRTEPGRNVPAVTW